MDITVKTFDDKRISELIKQSDPYLRKYIKCLKGHIDGFKALNNIAINKLNTISLENKRLKNDYDNLKINVDDIISVIKALTTPSIYENSVYSEEHIQEMKDKFTKIIESAKKITS